MCLSLKKWRDKRKEKKAQRQKREEQLWLWIGCANLSRAAPKEMIGPQNLSGLPDWMLPLIKSTADPRNEVVMKFEYDKEYEYRFKPRTRYLSGGAFYVDIYRRTQHWKRLL